MPRTYGKSKGKAKQTRLSFIPATFSSEDQDADADHHANLRYSHPSMPTLRRGRSGRDKNSAPTPFVTIDPSSEDSPLSEPVHPPPKSSRTRENASSQPSTSKESRLSAAPCPAPIAEDSESDIEVVHSARKRMMNTSSKRKRSPSLSESEHQQIPDESDADEIAVRPRRKLRRGAGTQTITLDDDTSDEQASETAISIAGGETLSDVPHTPLRDLSQDKIDLEEDLEALQDSVVKESRTRGNLANSARVQRQRHLQALRRRRAGKKEEDDGEQDQLSSELEAPELISSESEHEEPSIKQPQFRVWAGESESSDVESSIGKNEDLDRYEEDFVLEDEEDKLGVPSGLDDIPIEFSRHSYKQLKDYFQDAVEWMVHNQLNPAFPRSDPVYMVAFDKLEAEVRGRTGSQLVSSVWNTGFRRALLARPQIEVTQYPIEDDHACDACNRSGHPASFDVKLYGKAYSLETLEPLSDADSDEDQSDSEEENQERDRDGYSLPDEDTRFYLGRHCMKKAEMAHTLTHWRFRLNEWVVEYLRITGYMSDKKILKRSHWSQKKKNKRAAKVVNKMIESGEVKKLWRDFHINLRTARESTTS